jgi:hypothetical protein
MDAENLLADVEKILLQDGQNSFTDRRLRRLWASLISVGSVGLIFWFILTVTGVFAHPQSWIQGQFSLIFGGFVFSDFALILTMRFEHGGIIFLPYSGKIRIDFWAGAVIIGFIVVMASVLADSVAKALQTYDQTAPYWIPYLWFFGAVLLLYVDYVLLFRESREPIEPRS